jgi:predicted Zn-dependent peptidase
LEQVHLCLGLQGVAAGHKDRYAAHALNGVLGGSVSSRLFQEVREKRGLVYSIYSFLSTYSDGGMITIYAGTRPREVERVIQQVQRELKRMRSNGVEAKDLARVKNQMKGSLMLSLESSHSRMSKLAKDELSQGCHVSLEQMISEIDRVTTEQVYRVGRELLNLDRLSITALGPVTPKSLQSFSSQ